MTTINYEIIDGGIYDEDGMANGEIVDPAGPSVPVLGDSGGEQIIKVGTCSSNNSCTNISPQKNNTLEVDSSFEEYLIKRFQMEEKESQDLIRLINQ